MNKRKVTQIFSQKSAKAPLCPGDRALTELGCSRKACSEGRGGSCSGTHSLSGCVARCECTPSNRSTRCCARRLGSSVAWYKGGCGSAATPSGSSALARRVASRACWVGCCARRCSSSLTCCVCRRPKRISPCTRRDRGSIARCLFEDVCGCDSGRQHCNGQAEKKLHRHSGVDPLNRSDRYTTADTNDEDFSLQGPMRRATAGLGHGETCGQTCIPAFCNSRRQTTFTQLLKPLLICSSCVLLSTFLSLLFVCLQLGIHTSHVHEPHDPLELVLIAYCS